MSIGDKIIYNGIEYTIWEIDNDTLHLVDECGNGIAILITEI
jgi:hypothetical protein